MIKKTETDEAKPFLSNRDKKLKPHRTQFWCGVCDATLVAPGSKCPRCDTRDVPRRLRK